MVDGDRQLDAVIVADIADAAGVARRTVHRYVAVKSDLVFGHEQAVVDVVEEVVESAPADAPLRDVVLGGLRVLADRWPTSRDEAVVRAEVVAGSAELVERDLAKRARMRDLVVASLGRLRPDAPHLEVAVWTEAGLAAFHSPTTSGSPGVRASPRPSTRPSATSVGRQIEQMCGPGWVNRAVRWGYERTEVARWPRAGRASSTGLPTGRDNGSVPRAAPTGR
ncbi:hypothetical protein IF650_04980 [Cellulosimicrobium terreum]|nr:hypothetical protein [Cellulosimicrobium terreum]